MVGSIKRQMIIVSRCKLKFILHLLADSPTSLHRSSAVVSWQSFNCNHLSEISNFILGVCSYSKAELQ